MGRRRPLHGDRARRALRRAVAVLPRIVRRRRSQPPREVRDGGMRRASQRPHVARGQTRRAWAPRGRERARLVRLYGRLRPSLRLARRLRRRPAPHGRRPAGALSLVPEGRRGLRRARPGARRRRDRRRPRRRARRLELQRRAPRRARDGRRQRPDEGRRPASRHHAPRGRRLHVPPRVAASTGCSATWSRTRSASSLSSTAG